MDAIVNQVRFSQERLNVWIYKFLLGTLSSKNTSILKRELEKRDRENKIRSAIEGKLLAAFMSAEDHGDVRIYLAQLLNDWGRRNWDD